MATALKVNKFNIVQATKRHTATLFFFHGSGDTGQHVKEWIDIVNREELKFPHIKIIYPTAPAQPYTPNGGMFSNVWFNRKDISINVSEEEESINSMCQIISELINKEHANGISYDKMVLAGFSMGGALSMHLAYRFKQSVAGCCAMSSFLNKNSMVYRKLVKSGGNNMPQLLQFHGTADNLVPFEWGKETSKTLKEYGINTTFITLENIHHELFRSEIHYFKQWLNNILPEQ